MKHSVNWGIVGGGFLGMTIAHRLAKAGQRVALFEGAATLGGLASAWSLGDVVWDRHYHVTALSDTTLRALLRELGLEDSMRWVNTRTGFYVDGQLYSLSNAMEFLRFPPLNPIEKLRLGATILAASRIKDWKPLESVTAIDWLTRWSGRSTVDKIWRPLLRAKLGDMYDQASAAFIWAIIARMYAARRTGMKKEMFGYVPGGYARVLERYAQVLENDGVRVVLGRPASKVEASGAGVSVQFADSRELFDRVVVTTAAPLCPRIVSGLRSDEIERLNGVRYQGILCASLLLRKPLAGYYVTNITDASVPFTAVIEMSALVDPEFLGGHTLVYLPKYVAPDAAEFALSDDEIRERFVRALEAMYPAFRRDDILSFRISRVRYVFAVSTLGYSQRVPPIATSLPGVFLVNSSQILNGTLNVNETLQLAHRAADEFLALPERVPDLVAS